MKLNIFWRLIIGYLVIFILAMAMTTYTIAQLRRLEKATRFILKTDILSINYEQKLSDALFSMMRYEKKYVIFMDKALYNQFLEAKSDFENNLKEIKSIADTPETKKQLKIVDDFYQHYQSTFKEEVVYVNTGRQYPENEFKKEKESAVNGMMEALKELRNYYQQNTDDKIKKLNIVEANASKVAIIIGVGSFIFGIVISLYITLGITRPLSIMKKRTREIANGNFRNDLTISSPPEIKELTEAFNSMCTKLKEIDKMKSDFFSLMSHELRTPLTTIRESTNLFIEGLNGGKAIDKKKRLLTIINEECNRLINLVNSLLDLSKMESGMIIYNFTQADLVSLINKVTREMEPLAKTKNIKIKTKISSGLPLIKVDCNRMLQVMRNLIGNALKFTHNGGNVKVSARTNEHGLMVSVADTGIGISEKKLSIIFDKYKQATLASPNKIVGSGLGLFIVKEIINAHGGEVWAESTLGKGSTFTFLLPL
jgi:two-component system sensor histidine kinase GlrK